MVIKCKSGKWLKRIKYGIERVNISIPMQIGNSVQKWRNGVTMLKTPFIKIYSAERAIANYDQLRTLTGWWLHIICIHSNLALIRYGPSIQFRVSTRRERDVHSIWSTQRFPPPHVIDMTSNEITKGLLLVTHSTTHSFTVQYISHGNNLEVSNPSQAGEEG